MILKRSRSKVSINKKVIFYTVYGLLLFTLGIAIQRFGTIGNVIIPYIKSEKRILNNFIKPYDGDVINIDVPFDEFDKLKQSRNNALQSGLLQNLEYVSCNIKHREKAHPAKIRLKGDMKKSKKDEASEK